MGINGKAVKEHYHVLIAYGDLHIPRNNRGYQRILLDIISDVQPDVVLDGGDIICADCLSKYLKKHSQLVGLQEELDEAYMWMVSINSTVPSARKIMLRDNHFWRRLEDKKKGELWLESLKAAGGRQLLRLEELGWEDMVEYQWRDQLLFVHGDDKAGSQDCPVNRTRNMVRNTGLSIVRFHSHTSGVEVRRHMSKEHMAIQLGAFEDLDHPDIYMKHPKLSNWSTSFGVFYLPREKGEDFQFEPIFFRGGKAVFNGRVYGL